MVMLREKPLRGVARRQAEALKLHHDDHDSELVPLFAGTIAISREQDFVAALMADLKLPDWERLLLERRAKSENGIAKLHQPIHREFAVAMYEARCKVPGFPRIDPRKIVAQGLVIRKGVGSNLQGWIKSKGAIRSWLPVNAHDDPKGSGAITSGNAEIDRLLKLQSSPELLQEDVAPLFLAPPDVCAAMKKTVLFGIVPVTSSEMTESSSVNYLDLANTDGGELDSHLCDFLKPGPARELPVAGTILDPELANNGTYGKLTIALRQLVQEAGVFDETSEAAVLRNVLASLGMLEFVTRASPVLVEGRPNTNQSVMPTHWPEVTPALRDAFYTAVGGRFKNIVSHVGKYDERDATYRVQAFIRLTCGNCPPKLVWCDNEDRFSILPWWDSAGPPMRIPLPPFDLTRLPKLKPNVAFEVPKPLAKFLNQDFSNALKSKPSQGFDTGIDWICSFSIPIITICAFILLSIILALLNIIFFWLPLVKICLPLPKVKQS